MHSLLLAARPNRVLDAVLGSMCDAVALSDAVKLVCHAGDQRKPKMNGWEH